MVITVSDYGKRRVGTRVWDWLFCSHREYGWRPRCQQCSVSTSLPYGGSCLDWASLGAPQLLIPGRSNELRHAPEELGATPNPFTSPRSLVNQKVTHGCAQVAPVGLLCYVGEEWVLQEQSLWLAVLSQADRLEAALVWTCPEPHVNVGRQRPLECP